MTVGPGRSADVESSGNTTEPQTLSTDTQSADDKQLNTKPQRPNFVSNEILEDFILDGLAFSSMRDRQEEVTAAHRRTFEWIFGERSKNTETNAFGNHFTSWLTTNDLGPIYWITGKPGSGKSTLTRFLFEHEQTKSHLNTWSLGRPVAMAGFYFWTSGSHEQKSQTGLLRYLLHQLLSTSRSLIPEAFGDLWDKVSKLPTKERIKLTLDWTADELMVAFNRLMRVALEEMNICLFIDGLDEFEGDHEMIINFFKNLVEGQNGTKVKLCLSSRPWPVFEAAFEHSVPNLKLQDLTYGDMRRYTEDRLNQQADIRRLSSAEPDFLREIADEAVKKADGVFLWVRLAVNQMLAYARDNGAGPGLQSTLRSLPDDLDNLFEHLILENKTAVQLSETATIFLLIRAREMVSDFIKDESAHSLTVWELGFAFDENDNDVALYGEVEAMSDREIERRGLLTADYLQRGFSGLLEIFVRPSGRPSKVQVLKTRLLTESKINFIHRTVRDWLLGPRDIAGRLSNHGSTDFDPHLALLRSYIVRMKRPIEEPERHRRLDDWWPDISLAMTHARYVAKDPHNLLRPMVNELDRTITWYWVPRPREAGDHWARHAFGAYEVRMKAPPIEQPFRCLATKFGLTQYLQQELDASATVEEAQPGPRDDDTDLEEGVPRPTPLLSYAVEFLCSRKKSIYPLSDPELVMHILRTLSQRGKGPNDAYINFDTRKPITPWLYLLRHLRDARRRGWIEYYDVDSAGTLRWGNIVRQFLSHGADVNAIILKDIWDPEISAIGVMELLEKTYGSAEVKSIREMMQALLKPS